MKQVSIPADDYQWTKAGRPGGYSHINLEEASALFWSAPDCLRRPHELHSRALHLVDSTAVAGAAKKGRSASRVLNARMRQLLAISVAGDLELFFSWVASGENPSDDPSSWYGIRRLKTQHVRPSGIEKIPNATDTAKPVVDPACPLELLARDAMGYGVELVPRGPRCSYPYCFHFCFGFHRYVSGCCRASSACFRAGWLPRRMHRPRSSHSRAPWLLQHGCSGMGRGHCTRWPLCWGSGESPLQHLVEARHKEIPTPGLHHKISVFSDPGLGKYYPLPIKNYF